MIVIWEREIIKISCRLYSTMICVLCVESIEDYDPSFNDLRITEERVVQICNLCVEKFEHWQTQLHDILFPMSRIKEISKKKGMFS